MGGICPPIQKQSNKYIKMYKTYKIHFIKSQDNDFTVYGYSVVKALSINLAIEYFEKNINSFAEIVKISKIN